MPRKSKSAKAVDLEIVYRDPHELKVDPKNARTHSQAQIAQIRRSIKEFGFTNPILLRPSGMIGAGHGRAAAAIEEGLKKVPTITIANLTEKQWRAYALADNKLALNAGWDLGLLKSELSNLTGFGLKVDALGFSRLELDKMGIAGFGLKAGAPAETNVIGEMKYAVVIRCASEAHQFELLARFEKEGLKCEALIS